MSSRMNEIDGSSKRKVKSIANSINVRNTFALLGEYISLDIFFALLITIGIVYCVDMHFFGKPDFLLKRSFCMENGEFWYLLGNPANPLQQLNITVWLQAICYGYGIVFVVQILHVISHFIKGTKWVDKSLEPVYEMARQAQKLSEIDFDETKYQDLENAITNLKVEKNDAHIHMYNEELSSLEQAINGLIDRMRESYRMQTRFVSDASHELRTPIAVVQGYVNMLDRWGKNDESILEESIEAIKHEADHMQTLVEQLLFLARGDSNRQKMESEEIVLNDLLREVYEESLMIDEKHHYYFTEQGVGTMIGDPAMIKQSARILVDNACKYTPEGEDITIRVGMKEQKPFYEIEDHGIGMRQENLEHIFDRFYRADDVRNSKTGGSGLGLSIAKWIVDQHNGYYQIISFDQVGTRFTVYFEA